ncbi:MULTISPECIES: replication initiation factor domain-containing protein [Bacillales]|nr:MULTISPECIES: replication initiation factor domain-containing protein [Bacillaceae]
MVTGSDLSGQFRDLLDSHGIRRLFTKLDANEFGYGECVKLGCITVFMNPTFRNTSRYKVIINPSKAGMSFNQLHQWMSFIVDDPRDLLISRIDPKVDHHDMNLDDLFDKIWVPRVRKTNDIFKDQGTMYFGSRKSDWQVCVYNKAKEQGIIGDWSRIEIRIRFKRAQRIDALTFFSRLKGYQPFKEVYIVENDQFFHDLCLHWRVDASLYSVQECLKSLTPYQRKQVLGTLQSYGKIRDLQREFELQLEQWLNPSSYQGTTPHLSETESIDNPVGKSFPYSVGDYILIVVPRWNCNNWLRIIVLKSVDDLGRSPPPVDRVVLLARG